MSIWENGWLISVSLLGLAANLANECSGRNEQIIGWHDPSHSGGRHQYRHGTVQRSHLPDHVCWKVGITPTIEDPLVDSADSHTPGSRTVDLPRSQHPHTLSAYSDGSLARSTTLMSSPRILPKTSSRPPSLLVTARSLPLPLLPRLLSALRPPTSTSP
jgi:hypothetical protein